MNVMAKMYFKGLKRVPIDTFDFGIVQNYCLRCKIMTKDSISHGGHDYLRLGVL